MVKVKKNMKVKKNKVSGKKTITLTYCDVSENHNGMKKNGVLSNKGFSKLELEIGREYLESIGIECDLVCLNDLLSGCELDEKKKIDEAYILVMRDCVRKLLEITGNSFFLPKTYQKISQYGS